MYVTDGVRPTEKARRPSLVPRTTLDGPDYPRFRSAHRRLAAFADIVIELSFPRHQSRHAASAQAAGALPTRRRIFTGVGRYPGTLESVTAELNAAGTDYVLVEDTVAPSPTLQATLQSLLSASPEPLTHRDLQSRWPGDPPRGDSLWRALARGLETGLLTVTGAGTKNDPQRFALAGAPAAG
jgi:hypothetical protein